MNPDSCVEKQVLPVLLQGLPGLLHGLPGLPGLPAWLANLLRREVEVSLEKLDLVWDRTYAWEMFLDMMVGELTDHRSRIRLEW